MLGSADEQDSPRRRTSRRRASTTREERETREPRVSRRVARREVVAPKPEIDTSVVVESRKAPTPIAGMKEGRFQRKKMLMVTLAIILLGVGASAAVGLSDAGRIDVQQTIEARNERIRNNQANEQDMIFSTIEIPVQDTDSAGKVDGGLLAVGTGEQTADVVVIETASTSATSTNVTASSTEVVASSTVDEIVPVQDEAQPSAAPQGNSVLTP